MLAVVHGHFVLVFIIFTVTASKCNQQGPATRNKEDIFISLWDYISCARYTAQEFN